ncbi:MAG: 16S rRNA (cytosine(1402)-N(4))-methyltransferase RsmH [Acidobacteria bacterium]|nr:16S rRNA (cytosine(1402)-N(4))-methyltransferase RsmH [Acidobacteriota bacterium]
MGRGAIRKGRGRSTDAAHVPVLLREALEYLEPERGGTFVDCTLGLGGHARALLAANPTLRLIGIDRDPAAHKWARRRLAAFGRRVLYLQGEFGDATELLRSVGVEKVQGVLADLGVSSLQLDTPERGFSFRFEGPLDMRMGDSGRTAGEIVNRYGEADLVRIFSEYGEERQARRVARAIVAARRKGGISTTSELREVIHRAKRHYGRRRIDPATQVFQALRIEVNRELSGLERLMGQVADLLERDGRLVIISYQSLEDRIVKNTLRDLARGEIDEVTGRSRSETRLLEVLTRKPVRPSEAEVAVNPRARSARLRSARRL